MSGCALSADAALDLDDIWEYIAANSIDAAESLDGKTLRRLRGDGAKSAHGPQT